MNNNVTNNDLENAVVSYVQETDTFVSFNTLVEVMEEKFHVGFSGEDSIVSPADPSIVVWPGLDAALADAIIAAVQKKKVFLVPALASEYATEGVDLRERGFRVADHDNTPPVDAKMLWTPMTLSSQPLTVKPPPFLTAREVAVYASMAT